jgi:hypothetical protein
MSHETQSPDTPTRTRAEISRANGAKSKGPKTPEGKAISSRNATRHGLTAKQVVLPEESPITYRTLLRSYIAQFKPETPFELDLVSVMAVSRWRLRRLVAIETNMLTNKLESRREAIEQFVENPHRDKKLAWIFEGMSSGPALALAARYEGGLSRVFDRAFKQLQALRADQKTGASNRTQPSDDLNP